MEDLTNQVIETNISPRDYEEDFCFRGWLNSVKEKFQYLTNSEKTETLQEILQLCGSEQLRYLLQDYIPLNCFVDYLKLLPVDISYYILRFLDEKDVLNCCMVSKHWNDLVSNCKELWTRLLWKQGFEQNIPCELTALDSKTKLLQFRRTITSGWDWYHIPYSNDICFEAWNVDRVSCSCDRWLYVSELGQRGIFCFSLSEDGRSLTDTIIPSTVTIRSMSCDNEYLYIASDRMAVTYILKTGHLYKEYYGHVRCLMAIDASLKHGLMVTGAADATVRLWNTHTAENVFTSSQEAHNESWVTTTKFIKKFSQNFASFVSSDKKNTIIVWVVKIHNCKSSNETYSVDAVKRIAALSHIIHSSVHESVFYCLTEDNSTKHISGYSVQLKTGDCLPCVNQRIFVKIPVNIVIQDIIGVGERMAVLMCVLRRHNQVLAVFDVKRGCLIFKITLLSNTTWLLEQDWLNGFQQIGNKSCLFAFLQEEHFMCCRYS